MFFDMGCDVPRAGKMMVGRKIVMEGSIVGANGIVKADGMVEETLTLSVLGFPIVAAEVMV